MENDELGSAARAAEVPSLSKSRATAVGEDGPKSDATGAKGVSRYHEFALNFTDSRGRIWSGEFRTKVLNVRSQIALGKMIALLRGNQPPAVLDETTLQLTEMVAHITIACELVPEWAKRDALLDIHDANVIVAIYKEVRAHEARFWGADTDAKDRGDGAESAS